MRTKPSLTAAAVIAAIVFLGLSFNAPEVWQTIVLVLCAIFAASSAVVIKISSSISTRVKRLATETNFLRRHGSVASEYKKVLHLINEKKLISYKSEIENVGSELISLDEKIRQAEGRIIEIRAMKVDLEQNMQKTSQKNDPNRLAKTAELLTKADSETDSLTSFIKEANERINNSEPDLVNLRVELELGKVAGIPTDISQLTNKIKSLQYIVEKVDSN